MRKYIQRLLLIFSLYSAIFFPFTVKADMSSTNYLIQFDSVGVGGTDSASSASYSVRDTLEFIDGVGTSTSYRVDQGYRAGIYDPVARFRVLVQDNASQVAVTSITSASVVVTTATGYEAGDSIAVIQNEGLAQVSAVGRITSVVGTTLNVDFFVYAGSLPVIDGISDYVYELAGSNISFSAMTPSVPTTGILAWEVDADVPTGYSVYVRESQDLQTPGGVVLNDVEDGAVTVGHEEYGATSSDQTLTDSTFDTEDTAFSIAFTKVASRSEATLLARDFLTLKVAAAETTINGLYYHTLTVVYVGNY